MDEREQAFLHRNGWLQERNRIQVIWVRYPAEITEQGVWDSQPEKDQGVFAGIENGYLFIRRDDNTLEHYHLDTIRGIWKLHEV